MTNLNNQLHALYASKWEGLVNAMTPLTDSENNEGIPACPLLIRMGDDEAFEKADIRLMVFGQETNRWYESFHADMDAILGYYDEFFNDGVCWSYGGQFWNGVSRFKELLQQRYPGKTIGLVWNNVAKIGRDEGVGFPSTAIHDVERAHFNVIPQEIGILKPTLALFLSGPDYDSVIQNVFGATELLPVSENFSVRQLAQFSVADASLSIRTYHPGYLWRNDIDSFFNEAIECFDAFLKKQDKP